MHKPRERSWATGSSGSRTRRLGAGLFALRAMVFVGWLTVLAGPSSAQETSGGSGGESGGFAVDPFRPAPVLGRAILGVGTGDLLEHGRFSAGAVSHYQDDPLTMVDPDDRGLVIARFIDARVMAEVHVALGLFDHVELALTLPLVLTQSGEDLGPLGRTGEALSGFALGDLGISARVKILGGPEGFQLHLGADLFIPVGDQGAFASDGALRVLPRLGLGYAAKAFRVALEGGYELRERRVAATFVGEDVVRWGLGVRVSLIGGEPGAGDGPTMNLLVSGQGTIQTARGVDPFDPTRILKGDPSVSVEALGGLELVLGGSAGLALVAGGGVSILRAVGSPDVRAFLGVGWTSPPSDDRDGDGLPDAVDACPTEAEDKDGFQDEDGCPDPDDDGDGGPDRRDRCPNQVGVADDAGCPPAIADRDADGILDDVDRCPDEPEDKDGFRDEDGCPDPDNDGDGVPDALDKCPLAPEDVDGFQDEDGCPDPDNDGDGVADGADKCPDLPETFNGFEDEDGCPDNVDKDLVITATRIEMKKPVLFPGFSDAIRPESQAILESVAKLLVDHPYLTRVRVEAHTDSEGADDFNLALSQRRAEAVVTFLVARGVARERLVAEGFGESRPLVPNDRPYRRAMNRRIELHIVEINGRPLAPKAP